METNQRLARDIGRRCSRGVLPMLLFILCAAFIVASGAVALASPSPKASAANAGASKATSNGGPKPKTGKEANVDAKGSACDDLLAMSDIDTPSLDLLGRARSEGLLTSDPECLGVVTLRYLNQGQCETASYAADRAKELAPGQAITALASSMVKACSLSRKAAHEGGGVPVVCDQKEVEDILFDVGRAMLFITEERVAELALRTLEADLVTRCRDDGQMKAMFAAMEMADPDLVSPALHVFEKEPDVPWNLTGAALLRRLQRTLANGEPGPGGFEVTRSISRTLLEAWHDDPARPKAESLGAQMTARSLLAADIALARQPEAFGLFLGDLGALDQQNMLKSLPVLEMAAKLPTAIADAQVGDQVSGQLDDLVRRLAPLQSRPEGAVLLLKLRALHGLRADLKPCDMAEELSDAMASFGSQGARSFPLKEYKTFVRDIASRAREAARRCPAGMAQVSEADRILNSLQNDASPWGPVVFVEGGE
jgi:hypothetical protein